MKKGQTLIGGPRVAESELINAIQERITLLGWKKEEIVLENGNMPFLNDRYKHPENYINNPDSKIKPGDYKLN